MTIELMTEYIVFIKSISTKNRIINKLGINLLKYKEKNEEGPNGWAMEFSG
jgi:hypothetical protein